MAGIQVSEPAARDLTFVLWTRQPVQILAAEAGGVDLPLPELVTATSSVLSNGVVLGGTCPEHVRIGDMLTRGVIRSAADSPFQLTTSAGEFTLLPGDAILVGDSRRVDEPGKTPSLIAAHTIECRCTCTNGNSSGSTSSACGAACNPDGNQCNGINGTASEWDPDGDGPETNRSGTAQDCVEVLTPINGNGGGPGGD